MDAEIKQQFDDMGIEPPQEVVDKSVELCITYHIDDASEFVEQWMAFSISHLHGAEPSIEHLNEFERKVFQAKREKELMAASKKKGNKLPSALANLTHLNDIASSNSNPLAMYGVEDDMMDDYMPDMISAGVGSSTILDESEAVASTPSIYHTPKNGLPSPLYPSMKNSGGNFCTLALTGPCTSTLLKYSSYLISDHCMTSVDSATAPRDVTGGPKCESIK
ncbi:DNA polymerase alpha subunit B [Lucilia cuprina]|nr:DNA polymerase alpha subunit B [Lucilia cuprina]